MLALIFAAFLPGDPLYQQNPVASLLIEKGFSLPQRSDAIKLSSPLITAEMSGEEQMAALKKVSARYPFRIFVKKTPVSPFVLNLESVNDKDGNRIGQSVDVWFVAHGNLKTATSDEVLQKLMSGGRGKNQQFLTKKELAERNIQLAADTKTQQERLSVVQFDLIKLIQMSGVSRVVKTMQPKAVMSAMMLDGRFTKDDKYPNRWRKLPRKPGDAIGPPHPYSNFGGYAQIVEMHDMKGVLFVEMHTFLHEPQAWFDGRNLLRPKLPLAIKESVQSFRRELLRKSAQVQGN